MGLKRRAADGVKQEVRTKIKIVEPKKILVIQIRQVGDVLLTTPVVRTLKERFPSADIDFLADKTCGQLLLKNPYINELIIYDKNRPLSNIFNVRKRKYDWVIDFLGNPRSAVVAFLSGASVRAGYKHNWRAFMYNLKIQPHEGARYVVDFKFDLLNHMGVLGFKREPEIFLDEPERQKIKKYLNGLNIAEDDFKVCLCPTSRRPARRWKPEHFARLGEMLMDKYKAKVFLLWGPGEKGQIEEVVKRSSKEFFVIPEFSLRELAALVEVSGLVVANSNGPMHIGEALKVPTIAIYGPNEPVSWSLPASWSKWIRAEEVDCLGCGAQVCPKNMECMEKLTPERVVEFFHESFPNTSEAYFTG